jgi:two-component system nitrate/nitrite response regulator NarL
MNEPIRLFIADDNRLLREGLVAMLEEVEKIVVIGTAASGRKAVEQIKVLRPEVALIDIGMPAKDGIEVTHVLHRDTPEVKVVILGMCDLAAEIMESIEAGAAGYVLKEASFDTLVETIRAVHRGESFSSPQVTASLFSRIAELTGERVLKIPLSSVKLTPREVEIINQIAEGLSNKAIAQQLSIETQTVKNHVHNILDKLQLHNRLQAVEYAREKKLLTEK